MSAITRYYVTVRGKLVDEHSPEAEYGTVGCAVVLATDHEACVREMEADLARAQAAAEIAESKLKAADTRLDKGYKLLIEAGRAMLYDDGEPEPIATPTGAGEEEV